MDRLTAYRMGRRATAPKFRRARRCMYPPLQLYCSALSDTRPGEGHEQQESDGASPLDPMSRSI
jgi:hypothetical protein